MATGLVGLNPQGVVPGRGFDPSTWNEATQRAVAAWNAAHPGFVANGSQTGFAAQPLSVVPPTTPGTPAPGTDPSTGTGTNGPNPTQGMNLQELITYLSGSIPGVQLPTGASDPLSQAYLQSSTQRGIASLNAAQQLAQQQQQAYLRELELMGSDPTGTPTDAATQWRAQLQAQQAVQEQRLQQQQAELMGYDISGKPTQAAQTASQAAAQRWAELTGTALDPLTGRTGETLASRTQAAQQAYQQQQLAQQNAQFGITSGMTQQQINAQIQQAGVAAGMKQEEIDAQKSQYNQTLENTKAQFAVTSGMTQQQINAQREQFEKSLGLQTGQALGSIGGQMTEAARAARANEALQTGQAVGSIGGQMTEAARAARANEALQRANTAAQLASTPKDVFKSGAWWREMQNDPTGIGLAGRNGVNGYAPVGKPVPGTISMNDVMSSLYGTGAQAVVGSGGMSTGVGTSPPVSAPVGATGATPDFSMGASSTPGAATGASTGTSAAGGSGSAIDDAIKALGSTNTPGMSPGGPTEPVIGMGAGGAFHGRVPRGSAIKKIRADAFDHPDVKALFDQTAEIMNGGERTPRQQRATKRGRGKTGLNPGGPTNHVLSPERALERDRRHIRGLMVMDNKIKTGQPLLGQGVVRPGAGPGGPVDAPMWPSSGAAQPSVSANSDVGAPPQSAMGTSAPTSVLSSPLDAYGSTSSASVDPTQYDTAFNDPTAIGSRGSAIQEIFQNRGIQSLGPQALEAMNSTDKGILEGAMAAMGLSADDMHEAYAQSRLANNGNALSA